MKPFERLSYLGRAQYVTIAFTIAAGCSPEDTADSPRDRTTQSPLAAEQATSAAPASNSTSPPAAPKSFAAFDAYWSAFRTAVMANEPETIAGLTRFPFETRGDTDDSPLRKLDRDQFLQALGSMLAEDPGLLMSGKESQRQHIARSTELTERQYASGDESARVGVFQFEKQGDRWLFTRAYVGGDD